MGPPEIKCFYLRGKDGILPHSFYIFHFLCEKLFFSIWQIPHFHRGLHIYIYIYLDSSIYDPFPPSVSLLWLQFVPYLLPKLPCGIWCSAGRQIILKIGFFLFLFSLYLHVSIRSMVWLCFSQEWVYGPSSQVWEN